ncbi:MAG: hypothetical protein KUG78_15155, partial [Kangiellaceae bacterium]|nr:hypothetical protein [Kangiellaceae bacterium]
MRVFDLNFKGRQVALITLFLLISACSSTPISVIKPPIPPVPYLSGDVFGSRPQLYHIEQVFQLNSDQLADFKAFYSSHTNRHVRPNKRIYKYLLKFVKNYNYFNKTFTAEESLTRAQGNCLSLAILTTALAKVVGVETGYQLVDSAPIYQKEGNIVISSQHVRSLLFEPRQVENEEYFLMSRAGIVIDYFPSKNSRIRRKVEEPEFYAMYYRNSAADALIKHDLNRAYWLLREALALHPSDEHATNMMALVHQDKGLSKSAEKIYRHGL